MTKVTVDSDLRAKLGDMRDLVEFRDENGKVVGFFHPVAPIVKADERPTSSPIADDEIETARQQKTGRLLAEIVADLDRRS
jgi:hypothetical protein